jgi:organic hydroperoxide reductase OsmC/OhrA
MKTHYYQSTITWTGNKGNGTSDYLSYSRDHVISISNKPDLLGSSDTVFRGDGTKHNPEDMLLASLSVCHMLWYLHLCADAGINVMSNIDSPKGIMEEHQGSGGKFIEVILNPVITIEYPDMIDLALSLHEKAHAYCFIANSVNFPVKNVPVFNIHNIS